MTLGGKIALFVGGTLFGSAGFKLLSSKDAKKVYSHVTAAALRCKDEVMKNVELVQDGCADVLADAKQINASRAHKAEAEYETDMETAVHPHDWLDDNGKNDWEPWKVVFQEKNNSVWEATIKVANATDGRKIPYDVTQMNMLEGPRTLGTPSSISRQTGTPVTSPAGINATTGANQSQEKKQSLKTPEIKVGVEIDEKTESANPTQYSLKSYRGSDYVTDRDNAAKDLSSRLGISVQKAKRYIDSVNSVAKMIADDRARLDYESSPGRSSFVGNSEYGGSIDFSTICKKRRLYTAAATRAAACTATR